MMYTCTHAGPLQRLSYTPVTGLPVIMELHLSHWPITSNAQDLFIPCAAGGQTLWVVVCGCVLLTRYTYVHCMKTV